MSLSSAVRLRVLRADAHVGAALLMCEKASDHLGSLDVMEERVTNLPLQEFAGLVQVAIDNLRRAEKLCAELTAGPFRSAQLGDGQVDPAITAEDEWSGPGPR